MLHRVGFVYLRGSTPSKASTLCRSRRALPKRCARRTVALREAAVAVGGQGGRRVPATALSSLCLMLDKTSCDSGRHTVCESKSATTSSLWLTAAATTAAAAATPTLSLCAAKTQELAEVDPKLHFTRSVKSPAAETIQERSAQHESSQACSTVFAYMFTRSWQNCFQYI